jgi:hypothetical protein
MQLGRSVCLSIRSVQFKNRNGKDLKISYPCVMLNVMVAAHNTNDQYQTLMDATTKTYSTSAEMSIEFEVDGPYKVDLAVCHVLRSDGHAQMALSIIFWGPRPRSILYMDGSV